MTIEEIKGTGLIDEILLAEKDQMLEIGKQEVSARENVVKRA